MRTVLTIAVILAAVFVTRSVYAEAEVSKGDHYYQLYAETLESARQAAEKGHWDLYNTLYQKAQQYRREYEFYRKGAAAPSTVVYQTSPQPAVVYVPSSSPRTYYHTSPQIVYYTPAPTYDYTPGVSLSFGYYGGSYYRPYRYGAIHHRSVVVPRHYGYPGRSRHRGRSFGRNPRGRSFRGGRRH